jgi:hypothetical protein
LQPRYPASSVHLSVAFYSLSSNVKTIRNWHSLLIKLSFSCKDT